MIRHEWEPITRGKLAGFMAGVGLYLLLIHQSEQGFVFILDHANLLFHEAGHPVVGLVSSRLAPYGGTLGQLVFPLVLVIAFFRQGKPLSMAAGWLWLCENCFNIARYMADARALKLPLVGGGDHDWNTIFTRWNCLQYDTRIAATVSFLGWLGVGATVAWVCYRAWKDREPSHSQ